MRDEGRTAAIGLFAIHYKLARERSDRGFLNWNARARELEARPGQHLKLLSRPGALDRAALDVRGSPLAQHAAAALMLGAWLTRERRWARSEFAAALDCLEVVPTLKALQRVAEARTADQALSIAYTLALEREFDFEIIEAMIDALGVTRFAARVSRPAKHGDDIAQLALEADPQRWKHTLPDTFAESVVTSVPSPDDPFDDLVPLIPAPVGAWKGSLFEAAEFPLLPGMNATEFRNSLNVDYAIEANHAAPDDPTGVIALEYSLYEALSNSVFGGPRTRGGLDVDSGSAKVDLTATQLSFMARKNIRVTAATSLHSELNLFALPFLTCWLSAWLIGAVCR